MCRVGVPENTRPPNRQLSQLSLRSGSLSGRIYFQVRRCPRRFGPISPRSRSDVADIAVCREQYPRQRCRKFNFNNRRLQAETNFRLRYFYRYIAHGVMSEITSPLVLNSVFTMLSLARVHSKSVFIFFVVNAADCVAVTVNLTRPVLTWAIPLPIARVW